MNLERFTVENGVARLAMKGGVLQVDEADLPLLANGGLEIHNGYAKLYRETDSKHRHSVARIIMGEPEGLTVDHINRDRLDNRRCNLRVATIQQQAMNRNKASNTLYKYKGVMMSDPRKKKRWRAYGKIYGVKRSLGYYMTQEEAAMAYNAWAEKVHGAFASLNIIIQKECSACQA